MSELAHRPYEISWDVWERCMEKFPIWLQERGGIVVYENHMLDSSSLGSRTYVPARYEAEDGTWVDAPADQWCPGGGLPSLRQQRIDHIKLEEFDGDVKKCVASCFKESGAPTVSFRSVAANLEKMGTNVVTLALMSLELKELRKLAKEAGVRALRAKRESLVLNIIRRAEEERVEIEGQVDR